MRNLSELLSKKTKRYQEVPETKILDEKTLFFLFVKILGEEYGQRGRNMIFPEQFIDGVLRVRVASPLWANELMLQKALLCERLNHAFGSKVLEDIEIRHGARSSV